jgi:hypothetical protein
LSGCCVQGNPKQFIHIGYCSTVIYELSIDPTNLLFGTVVRPKIQVIAAVS